MMSRQGGDMRKPRVFEADEYTRDPRDAKIAASRRMGRDIKRGIVELVTNSDQAYGQQNGRRVTERHPIVIELRRNAEPGYCLFQVRDRATGMSPDDLWQKFSRGGRPPDSRGRSFFGIGAKDCAVFGRLVVETIDADGWYARFEMSDSFRKPRGKETRATAEDRKRMGLEGRGTGTTASVFVRSPDFRFPQFTKLHGELSAYYALRDIVQRCRVMLMEPASQRSEKLVYHYPWTDSQGQLREDVASEFDGVIELPEGFAKPRLNIYRFPEPFEGSPTDPVFQGGVIIKSTYAIHGLTLLGLEHDPIARKFAGVLEDPNIDRLMQEWDDREQADPASPAHPADNPGPVVNQDRTPANGGLDPNHPYTARLFGKARAILESLVNLERQRTAAEPRGQTSASLRNSFDRLGPALGRYLEEEETTAKPKRAGLYFIPPGLTVEPSGTRTAALYYRDDLRAPSLPPRFDSSNVRVCQVIDAPTELGESLSPDIHEYRWYVTVKGGPERGQALITAHVGEELSEEPLRVNVAIKPPIPMEFGFEKENYFFRPGVKKRVRVLVPIGDLDQYGEVIRGHLEPGKDIVWRAPDTVRAELDEELGVGVATFVVEGRTDNAQAKIRVVLGPLEDEATLHVRRTGVPPLKLELDDKETDPPPERAAVLSRSCLWPEHKGYPCLHIFTRHPHVEDVVGSSLERQDTREFRLLAAELITTAVVQYKVERDKQLLNADRLRPTDVYVKHHEHVFKQLSFVRRHVVDTLLAPAASTAEPERVTVS